MRTTKHKNGSGRLTTVRSAVEKCSLHISFMQANDVKKVH